MPDFDAIAANVVKAAQDFLARALVIVNARIMAVERRLDALPPPRDGQPGAPGAPGNPGKDGAPGRDGLGFDDLAIEFDGARRLTLAFVRGVERREFSVVLPIVLDCGVWHEGTYTKGDGVTWGGSFWIAQRDTDSKPDSGDGSWRLSVKKGRDAR